MRRTAFFWVLVFVCSIAANAGTITSLSPNSIDVTGGGEFFLTINGTSLGNTVTFTGPSGTHSVAVNYTNASATRVITWVPAAVASQSGSYSVTVTGNGTSGPATFTVVNPFRRFVLLMPDVLIASALSREGAYPKWELTTWSEEHEPTPPTIECSPKAGSLFKMGTTKVSCTATNWQGERSDGSFNVTVVDDGSPELKLPKDIQTEASEENGAIVKFDTSAFDAIDGDLRVSCDHASGTLFPIGRTRVSCNAADLSLNPAFGSFIVDVRGKGRLALRVPDKLVAEAEGPEGSFVEFEVEAYNTEDPEPKVKCDPESGDFFKLGTTLVTCYGEDRFGSTAEARFELTVADTLGPVLSSLFAQPEYLVPVDGNMVSVRIVAEPIDLVDPFPRCTVTGVTANEEISLDDWKIVSEREVLLRAATRGKTDRIYRVSVSCTDSNRNESAGIATVVVPASGEAPKPGSDSAATGRRRAGGK